MKNRCRVSLYPLCGVGKFFLIISLSGMCMCTGANAQINAYAKITAISGKTLTLSNINQANHTFAAGEQVIIIQMTDNVIGANTANTATFGTIAGIANAGVYEAATIASV